MSYMNEVTMWNISGGKIL